MSENAAHAANQEEINHVADLTKRIEVLYKKAGLNTEDFPAEHGNDILRLTTEVVRFAESDRAADLILEKVGGNLGKTVAKHVSENVADDVASATLLAYKNWRWYADRVAGGALMTVGAVAILGTVKLVSDRFKRQPVEGDQADPFNTPDNVASFKASPRPAARGGKAPDLQNMMQ